MRITSDIAAEPHIVVDYTRRVFLTEAQLLAVLKSGGDGAGVYSAIPTINAIPALNALVLTTDQPVNFKLNSVVANDGVIAIKQGGILVAMDCNLAAGANLNALVNNTGANPANLAGFAGGV